MHIFRIYMVLWVYFLPFLQILAVLAKNAEKRPFLVTIFLYVPTLRPIFFWKSNAMPPKMTQMRRYTVYKKSIRFTSGNVGVHSVCSWPLGKMTIFSRFLNFARMGLYLSLWSRERQIDYFMHKTNLNYISSVFNQSQ